MQGLKCPHHAFHVRKVECLVVVLEVDPAGGAVDVLLPVDREAQHRCAACLVEGRDAAGHSLDLAMAADAKLSLGLYFGGHAVGVPAETPLDTLAAHGHVARHDVFDIGRQQVSVVGEAVGEGRAVVEDELVGPVDAGLTVFDRLRERSNLVPARDDVGLDLGEPW